MELKILIVDDELPQRIMLQQAITALGFKANAVGSPLEVVERLRTEYHDIVITDMQMPELTGLDLLVRIQESDPTVAVVVVTAHGTIETAVEAMKRGAEDYLQKPIELAALQITLNRIHNKRALMRENLQLKNEVEALRRNIGAKYHLPSFLSVNPNARDFLKHVEKLSQNRDHAFLVGEAGTDLEDTARIIHYNSPWASSPLLIFDCAAMPSNFHEAQLFGVETNVRDGVRVPGYAGLLEKAHMGTIIILNLHQLDQKSQARLSLAVRNQQCQRVGGTQRYHSDLRMFATSSPTDLESLLRWDFYHFLKDKMITIPPLRERREDIPIIALAIARRFGQQTGKNIDSLESAAVVNLTQYGFPGNHKELESLIEAAVRRCTGTTLTLAHLSSSSGKRSA